MNDILTLTLKNIIKLCYEILTITSGHKHKTSEKKLSSFQKGYLHGFRDAEYAMDSLRISNNFLRNLIKAISAKNNNNTSL